MDNLALNILLVEDSPVDAQLLLRTMPKTPEFALTWTVASRLNDALKRLYAREHFDMIVLDLTLPDSQGLQTVERTQAAAPGVPIVVVSGLDDENMALNAVRAGAQDYVTKGRLAGEVLLRTLRYAVERQRRQSQVLSLALTDILTDVYNRRGFISMATQQLKSFKRAREGISVFLILVDVDGLQQLNESRGYEGGNQALMHVAEILRQTFRGSDIIARLGGDEFVVLAASANDSSVESLLARLQANTEAQTLRLHPDEPGFKLSASAVLVEAEVRSNIDYLMQWVDQAMLEHKKNKKREQ